jgi:hypothetical protein
MRRRQYLPFAALAIFALCVYSLLGVSSSSSGPSASDAPSGGSAPDAASSSHAPVTWEERPVIPGPKPRPIENTEVHPISRLIDDAQKSFQQTLGRQSKTLDDAVKEYRRRYGIPPPPHFDKWFAFARKNSVQMIDEFDQIHDLMTPFWGLSPKTIRARAKEALGYDNFLIGISIRDHRVTNVGDDAEWQPAATKGMLEKFIQYLPDMDLAFNVHDEPRVVLQHDDLARLVHKAKTVSMPAANAVTDPANDFSGRAPEVGNGLSFAEVKFTRFNVFAHQATWTNSRMSCSPDSPARSLDDETAADDLSSYSIGDLGFVDNTTAMTDICLSPSLQSSYGFFNRPNAFNVVHELFPVFSQSKISSYSDIIYPSPWYWSDKVIYEEDKDMPWGKKASSLYWRGSTTGGFSRNGDWRRQHRQNFVQKINSAAKAKVMVDQGKEGTSDWRVKEVPRGEYRDLVDVHFSHVGQCDPGDCAAQIEFFDVVERVEPYEAWASKYLLDIDGNAFSGRFYAFLQSRSLTFKLAVFREWHFEWLKPWLHFVPLSLHGEDWLEAVRFFSDKTTGAAQAQKIAEDSRDWANKVVRKVDMEAWFFRLLLEYARVIDDNRENIGFDPSSRDKKLPTEGAV